MDWVQILKCARKNMDHLNPPEKLKVQIEYKVYRNNRSIIILLLEIEILVLSTASRFMVILKGCEIDVARFRRKVKEMMNFLFFKFFF